MEVEAEVDVFRRVATVRGESITQTLNWDGRSGFVLEVEFPAMGHRVEAEKTPEEARRDLVAWGDLARRGEVEVLLADEAALARIMDGMDWQPLAARP